MYTRKIAHEKLAQASEMIVEVSTRPGVSDEALFVYAVMALISDENGQVVEDDIYQAVNDPMIGPMAAEAVELLRRSDF